MSELRSAETWSPAYFARSGDEYLPRTHSHSGWRADQLTGSAVTGLLTHCGLDVARELDGDRRLVRAAYDLHSVSKLVASRATARVVKRGRSLTLIDVSIEQGGRETARAQLYFVAEAQQSTGKVWAPALPVAPPSPGQTGDRNHRQFFTDASGWVAHGSRVDGAARKAVWVGGSPLRPLELVEGEQVGGALLAGFAVDSLNAIASWGLAGIQFINTDATLSLARAPAGDGIGLLATHVSTGQGVLSASAAIFDRIGSLGVATVTSISHGSTVGPRLWAPVDE